MNDWYAEDDDEPVVFYFYTPGGSTVAHIVNVCCRSRSLLYMINPQFILCLVHKYTLNVLLLLRFFFSTFLVSSRAKETSWIYPQERLEYLDYRWLNVCGGLWFSGKNLISLRRVLTMPVQEWWDYFNCNQRNIDIGSRLLR